MKNKSCILLLFVITNFECESQDLTEEKRLKCRYDYKLLVEVPMYECTITGIIIDSVLMVAEPGALFTIVNKTENGLIIIRFWEWKENKALTSLLCFADSLCLKRKYFIASCSDVADRAVERFKGKSSFTAGTVLIPFKLRLQKFDFSKDITLGPAAGVRFSLSHFTSNYVNLVAGMGITSVTVDFNSTNGFTEESNEVPALTPFIGFVFELNRVVQAGLFSGWDYIAHNDFIHFIYHGKTWLSFGLGYSLISQDENRNNNKEKNP